MSDEIEKLEAEVAALRAENEHMRPVVEAAKALIMAAGSHAHDIESAHLESDIFEMTLDRLRDALSPSPEPEPKEST